MLYALHVRGGHENRIMLDCKKKISEEILKDIFTPFKEERYKADGKWINKKKVLFSGYIFVDTDNIIEFYYELNKISEYKKLVSSDKEPVPLSDEDIFLLSRFLNKDKIMEMSVGKIIGKRTIITVGPLVGLEGLITKIDRHKRKAWIETDMFGRKQKIQVGLEIVEKIEEEN